MSRALYLLGSLKATPVAMLLLAVGVLSSYRTPAAPWWWLVAPLGLLAVNLAAALLSRPRFRRQGGLLVFHLGLLAVLLLVAVGRLTSLSGRVEVLAGQAFAPRDVDVRERGPWHAIEGLHRVAFEQGAFTVEYAPGLTRGKTRSRVQVRAGNTEVFGDTRPLVVSGYRFYTTSNKGLAALLTWRGDDGHSVTGAVHFPSYPLNDWRQVNEWVAPSGVRLKLDLALALRPSEQRAWVFASRDAQRPSSLALSWRDNTTVLTRGNSVALPGGRLRFEGLGAWMGYRIAYDPTLPWLLGAALFGIAGLAWHFWGRFAQATAGAGAQRGSVHAVQAPTVART